MEECQALFGRALSKRRAIGMSDCSGWWRADVALTGDHAGDETGSGEHRDAGSGERIGAVEYTVRRDEQARKVTAVTFSEYSS